MKATEPKKDYRRHARAWTVDIQDAFSCLQKIRSDAKWKESEGQQWTRA